MRYHKSNPTNRLRTEYARQKTYQNYGVQPKFEPRVLDNAKTIGEMPLVQRPDQPAAG